MENTILQRFNCYFRHFLKTVMEAFLPKMQITAKLQDEVENVEYSSAGKQLETSLRGIKQICLNLLSSIIKLGKSLSVWIRGRDLVLLSTKYYENECKKPWSMCGAQIEWLILANVSLFIAIAKLHCTKCNEVAKMLCVQLYMFLSCRRCIKVW